MLLSGIYWWDKLLEISGVVDYMYLAINTGSSISTSSTYILFLTKMQKKANTGK